MATRSHAPQSMVVRHTTNPTPVASHHLHRNSAMELMPPHPGINPDGTPPMAAMAILWMEARRIVSHSRDHRRTTSMLQYPLHGLMPPAKSVLLGRRTWTSTVLCRHFYAMWTSTLSRSARFDGNWKSSS